MSHLIHVRKISCLLLVVSIGMLLHLSAGCASTPHMDSNSDKNTYSLRFEDNGNGTLIDKKTGNIWLKNANCFGTKTWTNAVDVVQSLSSGSCGLSDASKPGDWRLPTIAELLSLTDNNIVDSSEILNKSGFFDVHPTGHWTSAIYAGNSSSAWVVRVESGSTTYYLKIFPHQVWPIRSQIKDSQK